MRYWSTQTIVFIVSIVVLALLGTYKLGALSVHKPAQSTTLAALNPTPIETLSWRPRVQIYRGFASPEACQHIIDTASAYVVDSKVVGDKGEDRKSSSRTSKGTFLSYMTNDPVILDIEARLAAWSQTPPENGETLYLLRYDKSQEYKSHHDYFAERKGKSWLGSYGNRIATALIYLKLPEEGGQTTFPKAQVTVNASAGDAILFWDYKPNMSTDDMSLHASLPVKSGVKFCMTKWIRMRKYKQWGHSNVGYVIDVLSHPMTLNFLIVSIVIALILLLAVVWDHFMLRRYYTTRLQRWFASLS